MTAQDSSLWPPELDALVAAPEHHTLLFENERVRVIETRIPPGQTTRMHTHCWPAVLHTLSRSHVLRRDHQGRTLFDSRTTAPVTPPAAIAWTGPFPPHTLENVGENELRVIAIEIKDGHGFA